jgi:uncharacterized protein YrzB (UPF0473 family)
MKKEKNKEPMQGLDLLAALLDKDNHEPIVLEGEDGKTVTFEQVAVIPDDTSLYCILHPVDVEAVDDEQAFVFRMEEEENGFAFKLEKDEAKAAQIFDTYKEMFNS